MQKNSITKTRRQRQRRRQQLRQYDDKSDDDDAYSREYRERAHSFTPIFRSLKL